MEKSLTCTYAHESGRISLTQWVNRMLTLDVELGFIPQVDRHLLYYPWRINSRESGSEAGTQTPMPSGSDCENTTPPPATSYPKIIPPILVSCLRPLLPPADQDGTQKSQAAREEGQRLRIFNNIPAVTVSEEDLGALCIALGVETHGKDFLPNGRGGLGHLLASHTENGMNIIRLVYHHETQFEGGRSAGSGYSTLFAKHLACGCIPFARSKGGLVDTLVITPTVEQ